MLVLPGFCPWPALSLFLCEIMSQALPQLQLPPRGRPCPLTMAPASSPAHQPRAVEHLSWQTGCPISTWPTRPAPPSSHGGSSSSSPHVSEASYPRRSLGVSPGPSSPLTKPDCIYLLNSSYPELSPVSLAESSTQCLSAST